MPTGIKIRRNLDGSHQFTCYPQKNSTDEESNHPSSSPASPTPSGSSTMLLNGNTIDTSGKFKFSAIDELLDAMANLKMTSIFLDHDREGCQLCPDGREGPLKHIHVLKKELTIVNPYFKEKFPPLEPVKCSTCNKRLAYICSGKCTKRTPIVYYCSEECQKTNWPDHKRKCSVAEINGSIGVDIVESPRVAAQQINSSILVRQEPKSTFRDEPRVRSPEALKTEIKLRQPKSVTQDEPQPEFKLRQPRSLPKVDPFAKVPLGMLNVGKTYNTCVLATGEDGQDDTVVYVPYDNEKVRNMNETIKQSTEKIRNGKSKDEAAVGSTHLALSCEDDNWYRALVLKLVGSDQCEVFYIDFGNTEVIPIKNLRDLTLKRATLADVPAVAVRCKFSSKNPQGLVERAMSGEETFDMFVDCYDELNKQYILTIV